MLVRCDDVAAVVVTYKPEIDVLCRSLAAVALQVGLVVVIDNASGDLPVDQIEGTVKDAGIEARVTVLPRNEGLGTAINAGIGEARSEGYPYVVLLDQDSVPEGSMVAHLRRACQALGDQGLRIAAVGPRFRNPENGSLSSFIVFRRGRTRRVRCDDWDGAVEAGFLISSGSLIPMRAIDAVGGMDEALFIDHVDTEWCLRAKMKGWGVYGVCNAFMEHTLGKERHRLWLGRWRNISLHAPFRYYYIFRNGLLLRRRDYIPSGCRSALLVRDLMLAAYLILVPANRRENLRMMRRGITHGMRKISGPMVSE